MPTGYTADIAKGITFQQYAWNCARAFGALILMRDDPSDKPAPERFEPSDYNTKARLEAEARLSALNDMTDAEIETAAATAHDKAIAEYKERLIEKRTLRTKYEAMLAKVREFKVPSPDHVEYKAFMEKQILQSIDFDCDTHYMEVPKALTSYEWLAKELAAVNGSIEYHAKSQREEVERTESRNQWIAKLRAALSESDG